MASETDATVPLGVRATAQMGDGVLAGQQHSLPGQCTISGILSDANLMLFKWRVVLISIFVYLKKMAFSHIDQFSFSS